MNWYITLTILQRINLKELAVDICGIPYDYLIKFFGMRGSIELLKEKLEIEGILQTN